MASLYCTYPDVNTVFTLGSYEAEVKARAQPVTDRKSRHMAKAKVHNDFIAFPEAYKGLFGL